MFAAELSPNYGLQLRFRLRLVMSKRASSSLQQRGLFLAFPRSGAFVTRSLIPVKLSGSSVASGATISYLCVKAIVAALAHD